VSRPTLWLAFPSFLHKSRPDQSPPCCSFRRSWMCEGPPSPLTSFGGGMSNPIKLRPESSSPCPTRSRLVAALDLFGTSSTLRRCLWYTSSSELLHFFWAPLWMPLPLLRTVAPVHMFSLFAQVFRLDDASLFSCWRSRSWRWLCPSPLYLFRLS